MEKHVEVNNPIGGYYRPGLYTIDRLVQTTVGRQRIISDTLSHINKQVKTKSKKHYLISGTDGVGKTHILKVIAHAVSNDLTLNNAFILLVFPVDNYYIQSTAKLLLEMIRLLHEITGDESFVKIREELQEIDDDNRLIKKTAKYIKEFTDRENRSLLVIYDNINQFVSLTPKSGELDSGFELFLSALKNTVFISTFNSKWYHGGDFSPEIKYFVVRELRKLDDFQTIELIREILEWEGYRELLNEFDFLLPKIQALHKMTGGSPRLIMILSSLIVNESKIDIKKLFEQLLDQVSPFFYARINRLSQYERALISAVARNRSDSVSQSRLVKELRITPQQCSTAIGKLTQYDLVNIKDNPDDKRSRVYSIKEGFFDIWLAIGQSREPKNFLPLLGEFIEQWYSEKQNREIKRQRIWQELIQANTEDTVTDIENNEILLQYLADLGSAEEIIQNSLELAVYFHEKGDFTKARSFMNKLEEFPELSPFLSWMASSISEILTGQPGANGLDPIKQVFTAWSYYRADDQENLRNMAVKVSDHFISTKLFKENINFLEEIINLSDLNSAQRSLMANIAISYEKIGQYRKAIDAWIILADEANTTSDLRTRSTAYNNISQIYQDNKEYVQALKYLEMSLSISREINDWDGQSTTLNNIATIQFSQGFYEKALEYLKIALSIVKQSGNASIEAVTISNLALIYQVRGDYEKALMYLDDSILLLRELGNSEGESTALMNLSQVYMEIEKHDYAYDTMNSALSVVKTSMNYEETSKILLKMSKLSIEQNKKDLAYQHLNEARKITAENSITQFGDEMVELEKLLD